MRYFILLLVVCGSSCVAELGDEQEPVIELQADALARIEDGQPYQHKLTASRFAVGDYAASRSAGSVQKTSGSNGTFAVFSRTGGVIAVRRAVESAGRSGAVIQALPRGMSTSPEQSNAAVRSYFVRAGLPEREIGAMHVTTTMAGAAEVGAGVRPERSDFLWFTSHMDRKLAGIPVQGSHAYAALDQRGESIAEGVFWPRIPKVVVVKARVLHDALGRRSERTKFLKKVAAQEKGADTAEGKVKIVHTSASYEGRFEVRAAYVVVLRRQGKLKSVYFDTETGMKFTMADEVAPRNNVVRTSAPEGNSEE